MLLTRLHIPRLPVQHVSRPRLLALLEQGARGPLTLISAPAGSGKTTLLAEWAATMKRPVAWLSLEAADNDPPRFFSYLLAALASLDERIGATMQAYHFDEAQDSERVLTAILNDLARLLNQEAVVILDDYHVLSAEAIHAALRFLIEHLPPRLHIVIGTRVDPPLPLARLRARNQLCEVRTDELRFASDEVETLVRSMGLALSGEATDLLEQRTEGWIAGVQLLMLALRGQPDATAFLHTFRGTHRFLLDYVIEEVLAQQPPEQQRFLLLTCVLERMTGSLCDAVTDQPGGQERLAELLRANLFVSALDNAETWYRYHPLFADALRAHLQKREPALLPQLYSRASHWYEQHQGMEEACDYAFLAGDLPRAAKLVARLLPSLLEQGRFGRLKPWLNQLPPELITASPQLYIAQPWLLSLSRRSPQNAEQALERMEAYVQRQRHDNASGWEEPQSALILFRALTALSQNQPLHAFTLAREALRLLSTSKSNLGRLLSRFIRVILSIIYGAQGDLESAEHTLRELSVMPQAEPPTLVPMAAAFLLGELYRARGQLHKAAMLYEELRQANEQHPDLPPMPSLLMGFTLMRRAALLYEWNRLSEAAGEMHQVLEILPHAILEIIPGSEQRFLLALGLWMQARTELAQGRPEAARSFIELVDSQPEIFGELPKGKERGPIDLATLTARLALACGQVEVAEHWANTASPRGDDAPISLIGSQQIVGYLTLARVLIMRGRLRHDDRALQQVLLLLDNWRERALRLGFQGWLIEVQMLTALTLQVQGQTRQALTTLGPVLVQAEAEGYVRLFADEGQPMAQLLAQVSTYTTASPAYLRQLQDAIVPPNQARPAHLVEEPPQALIDPLSAREREVLALLAAGASNQQIADQLVISLNTAKRHVKHILAKLAATNRTQAVTRARDLNLF